MAERLADRVPELLGRIKGKEVDDRVDLLEPVLADEEEELQEHELLMRVQPRQDKHIHLWITPSVHSTTRPCRVTHWSRELQSNC